jgi:hypothetical protein
MKNSRLAIVSAILLGTCQFIAAAAEKKYGPGVTDTEIKIGQTVIAVRPRHFRVTAASWRATFKC